MNDTQPGIRTNTHGDPCPPWCTITNHEITDHHGGPWRKVILRPGASIGATAIKHDGRGPHLTGLEILVSAYRDGDPGTHVFLRRPEDAAELAAIIEMLAGTSPSVHAELAAALRAAVADIGNSR